MTVWGPDRGADYAARFAALAATGRDMHGEATFCRSLKDPGARVLDAGCGTGRVAIRLAELGYDCTGVDIDPSMLEQARLQAPTLRWFEADLASLGSLDLGTFELIVVAGNVIPLCHAGTEAQVLAQLAAHLAPAGVLVTGFGLDRKHLPPEAHRVRLADFDGWISDAGLALVARFATWDADPWDDGGYAVSVFAPAQPG